MARSGDDTTVAYPEVVTLHWEGPPAAEMPTEPDPDGSAAAREEAEGTLQQARRRERGSSLWEQIQQEARRRGGDDALWQRKLDAYTWVKLEAQGTAGDFARSRACNHATVRSWIAEVAKLAYQVGYRLHEDKLLLVGLAPAGLDPLRALVNRDAASAEAWQALREAESEYRGEDPYFHLNEGHVLRARGRLLESEATLKEGLAIAEARPVRALLWNARGQTFWDRDADSQHPLVDHLERAEQAFRRAALLDPSTYFPFVNLSQLAVDDADLRRAEYWLTELAAARKSMEGTMQDGLARYLAQAEWTGALEGTRTWRSGPGRWLRDALCRGVLVLGLLALGLATLAPPARAVAPGESALVAGGVSHSGGQGGKARGGAGGN